MTWSARLFRDREGFARKHRFIDRARAGHDDAIDGNRSPGSTRTRSPVSTSSIGRSSSRPPSAPVLSRAEDAPCHGACRLALERLHQAFPSRTRANTGMMASQAHVIAPKPSCRRSGALVAARE